MGKILFLSDIHGNMPAVRALEKEIERIQPDQIRFVGDAVAKGPESAQAVDWVHEHCDYSVKGNWDDHVCTSFYDGKIPETKFHIEQLGAERIHWLESLPFEDELLISGLLFRVLHGRPTVRLFQAYDSWEELEAGFTSAVTGKTYDGYICADSHMPYFRACHLGYAINTGSVGNSLTADRGQTSEMYGALSTLGRPRVNAVVLSGDIGGTEKTALSCEILSIPYDNEEAARIAEMYPGLPKPEAYQKEVLTGFYCR